MMNTSEAAAWDRRGFLRKSGAAIGGSAAIATLGVTLGAEPAHADYPINAAVAVLGRVWREAVAIPYVGTVIANHTFHPDATMLGTSNGFPTPIGGFHPTRLGLWKPTGQYTFEYFFTEFVYDPSGPWIGYRRPHAYATFAADFQSYTTIAHVKEFDTGDIETKSFTATSSATPVPFPTY